VPDDHYGPVHRPATIQLAFTDAERLALAGFLADYRGPAREAYTLALRQFTDWSRARSLAASRARPDLTARAERAAVVITQSCRLVLGLICRAVAPWTAAFADTHAHQRTDLPIPETQAIQ